MQLFSRLDFLQHLQPHFFLGFGIFHDLIHLLLLFLLFLNVIGHALVHDILQLRIAGGWGVLQSHPGVFIIVKNHRQ